MSEARLSTNSVVSVGSRQLEETSDKRARILAAATELIVKNGLQFPMSTIATKADVAIGSVYNYFESKDALILAVYADQAGQMNAALARDIDPAESAQDRIMAYIFDYIDYFWSDADRASLFEYLSNVPLIPSPELDRLFRPTRSYNQKIIELGQEAGILKPGGPNILASFVGGGIRNSLKWHRTRSSVLTAADRDYIAGVCWDAIRA